MSDRWFEYRIREYPIVNRRFYWPVSWQGWAVILAFAADILAFALLRSFLPQGAFAFFGIVALALLITIPLKAKREGTRWPGDMRDR